MIWETINRNGTFTTERHTPEDVQDGLEKLENFRNSEDPWGRIWIAKRTGASWNLWARQGYKKDAGEPAKPRSCWIKAQADFQSLPGAARVWDASPMRQLKLPWRLRLVQPVSPRCVSKLFLRRTM